MIPSFFIEKAFVKTIDFEVSDNFQNPLLLKSQMNTNLDIDLETKTLEGGLYHLVEIRVHLSLLADDEEPLYKLFLNYAAIVEIPDDNIAADEMSKIFKVKVPKMLWDNIRILVWQITREVGYPFMMREDCFDHQGCDEETETEASDDDISDLIASLGQEASDSLGFESVDYHWIIEDIKSLEEGQVFLNIYAKQVGEDALSDYECLPVYKCYYRFFVPIAYQHPDFLECDEEVWPMLFQLLYGNFHTECKLIDNGDRLPDIQFVYQDEDSRLVSELNLEEVKKLLSDLMTEAFTDISVNLISLKITHGLAESPFAMNHLMSKQEYFRIFDTIVSDDAPSFLGSMYEKIKECDIQTALYRH